MVLDVIGILLVILFFIRGYTKGFIVAAFSVLGILLGILCALKLSQSFAAWLLAKGYVTSGWVQLVSYIVLFVGVVIIVNLLAKLVQKAVDGLMLGTVNMLAGGIVYAAVGIVLWSSLLWIGGHMHIIGAETIASSKTYVWFSKIAPWFFEQAGKLMPFAKDTFSKLESFFDTVNHKIPTDVGAH